MRYVPSSDNKYVQCRYMGTSTATADFTNVANWQGVDIEPTPESKNLVESGGVKKVFDEFGITVVSDKESITATYVSDKTVRPNGTIVELEGYSYVAPIQVQPLVSVYLNEGYELYCGLNTAEVFETDSEGNFVRTIIYGNAETRRVSYTNTGSTVKYIGICCPTSTINYLLGTPTNGIGIKDITNEFTPNLTLLGVAWIGYDDHAFHASNNFRIYGFPIDPGKLHVEFVSAFNNLPSAISFYSGDVSNSSDSVSKWISGIQNIKGRDEWNVDIPDNAVYCIVTTRDTVNLPTVKYRSVTGIHTLNANIRSLQEDVKDIDSIEENADWCEDELKEIIESPAYSSSTLTNDNSSTRFLYKGSTGNAEYLNTRIFGISVIANGSGSISVIKGSGVESGVPNENVDVTILQTFNVVAGKNTLILDIPVILTENTDYIGINGDVKIKYGERGLPNGFWFYYLNTDTGTVVLSTKDMAAQVIVSTIDKKESKTGAASIRAELMDIRNKQQTISRLIPNLFIDKPYYYHWSPNGFVDNVPSQSVEDNFIAKRLGFGFVELNHQTTSDGKFVVTHGGTGGTFGDEFTNEYKDVAVNTMTYDDIVANVKYNSPLACYNHVISTLDSFLANCSQLGLGVYLRSSNASLLATVRKYLTDDKIILPGGNGIREARNFMGILTTYIGAGTASETVCNAEWLENFVNANGGAPYHLVLGGTHITYMINNDLLSIVGELKAKGIFIGGCYASAENLEKLTAAGGCGHAAQLGQCNSFSDANVGAWSPLDSDLSGWTIPSGITISSGRIVNSTDGALTVITPSTAVLPLAKGQVQARIKGSITFSFGELSNVAYSNYDEDKPINLNGAGIKKDMKLTMVIGANSIVEFLNYQVSKC